MVRTHVKENHRKIINTGLGCRLWNYKFRRDRNSFYKHIDDQIIVNRVHVTT